MDHYHPRRPIHRAHERGSALLIVFVLAAVIAIMLYREMPIAAFEARRAKEQTLIDRGHQYQRAVQLYYRRFSGRYPANMQMLENTNSIRFLRKRYVDPFTGKDDWRLLHAGPGGMLIDSKVQNFNASGIFGRNNINANGSMPLGAGLSGSTGTSATAGGVNPNANPGATSSFGSSSSSSSSDSDVTVPPVTKRAAVIASSGSSATPSSSELNQDPSTPLLPPTEDSAGTASNAAAGAANGAAPPAPGAPTPNATQTPGQQPGLGTPVQNGGSAFGNNAAPGTPGTAMGAMTGNTLGGSLAGVASKAKGHTVKKVNDQTDYSLWEFYYDPSKDTSMGNAGNLQNGAGGQSVQQGTQLGQPANSAFGSTSSGTSAFGSQATPTPNTPAAAPTTPDNSGATPTPAVPQQ